MANYIEAKDLYEIIRKENVQDAIDLISNGRHKLINSTKYDLLLPNGNTLPLKEVMRYTAKKMGYELVEQGFAGGQVNRPLKKLGFKIADKKGNPI